MISSNDSCRQLVAGNYDVILDDDEIASFKTVLSEFLSRFEHHENELLSVQQQTSPVMAGSYINEFKMLKELSKALKENTENFIDGLEFYNQSKNRYKDIIPFNHTRVILNSIPEQEPGSNYINANYVKGPSGSPRSYIACQGPLPHTLNDFWRMIWECRVSVIVMACNEQEMGKSKCEQYWPDQVNGSLVYGNIQVTLMRVRQINSDFLIRKLLIQLLEPEEKNSPLGQQTTESSAWRQPQTKDEVQEFDHNYHHRHHPQQKVNGNNDSNNNNLGTDTKILDGNRYNPHANDSTCNATCGFSNSGNSSASNESINTSDDSSTNIPSNQIPQYTNYHHRRRHHQDKTDPCSGGPRSNRTVLMERTVCQFHFQGWQDHGVPDSVQSILELVRLIREVQPGYSSSILVHCSAGCGRTGTICCIDYVYGLIRMGRLRPNFDLFSIISEMRQQRMAMVQTIEQYILCHRAVAALFMQQLQLLGFGADQSGCIAIENANDDKIGANNEKEGTGNDDPFDTSSSSAATNEQFPHSKCFSEQSDADQDLGPVFI